MLKEYPKFRAAAVQIAPVYHNKPIYFDQPATLDNYVKAIKEAASNGAELVVFPELAIPGYCHFALELTLGPENPRRRARSNASRPGLPHRARARASLRQRHATSSRRPMPDDRAEPPQPPSCPVRSS